MKAILFKDISQFVTSSTGLLISCLFLICSGLVFWVLPGNYNILEGGFAQLSPFFDLAPWLFCLLIPALTMKIFAEEKNGETLSLIRTLPLSNEQIIWAKFSGTFIVCLLLISPLGIYLFSINQLALDAAQIDLAAITGSFLGLLFSLGSMISLSIIACLISKSNLAALVLGWIICLFMYYGWTYIDLLTENASGVSNLGLYKHYQSISRGVLDLRDLLYFALVTISGLVISTYRLGHEQ